MQTTTNYGLKTYQSGDLFNPLTTENYNTEKLDTELKGIDDRTIGRATELVSAGVHAITLLDTDCKTFKFTATGNYDALETFTLNGISINAYMPDGSALQADAYKTGAVVMCSRNSDDSALTFYLSSVGGIAPDSEKLGGELPAYYATKSYADGIKSTADSASTQIQKKALVNTYYDNSVNKLYIVNADGTKGAEIPMGVQSNFFIVTRSQTVENIIDISGFDNSKTMSICAYYVSNVSLAQTFNYTISTVKTWSGEELDLGSNVKVVCTYNNGKLGFKSLNAHAIVISVSVA